MAFYAIVPAAGLSRRMGQPKLMMEISGRTVIERLLETLNHPRIVETIVVFRRGDTALAEHLRSLDGVRLTLIQPEEDPEDMRASVEHGLASVENRHAPEARDGWLLIPADHPVLDRHVLDELMNCWKQTAEDVLIPVFEGRRGHPVFFRWTLAKQVSDIPAGFGLNRLLHSEEVAVREVPVASDSILLDLDTPEDFERLAERLG